jgi:hypothetical protein
MRGICVGDPDGERFVNPKEQLERIRSHSERGAPEIGASKKSRRCTRHYEETRLGERSLPLDGVARREYGAHGASLVAGAP